MPAHPDAPLDENSRATTTLSTRTTSTAPTRQHCSARPAARQPWLGRVDQRSGPAHNGRAKFRAPASARPFYSSGMSTPIGSADLLTASGLLTDALIPTIGADWSVPASGVTWDVRTTMEHLVDVLGFYTLHLLPPSPERLPIDVACHEQLTNGQVLDIVRTEARGLATAAQLLDPATRAFHFHGETDVSGFLALACSEVVIHGHDAARGLGRKLEPGPDLVRKVLARLVPTAPTDTDPWQTLLWATGRTSLRAHPDVGPDWTYRTAPLS